MKADYRYRIITAEGKVKFANTGAASWFTLEQAKNKVDHSAGEVIHEYTGPGGDRLWEVL